MTFLTMILVLTAAPVDAPTPAAQLASMTWLSGAWAGPMWGGDFRAWYSTPDGGKILSHSELHSGGKVGFHEFEKFEVKGDHVHLQPYPGGRPAQGFNLTSLDQKAKKAVFENPKKDFPTRIRG